MIHPIRLCNDLFDDKNLSDLNLRIYADDHLVRITDPDNNPGGIYNTLVTDTMTRYTAFYGKVANELVKKATAEGTTITRNNARKAVYEKIVSIKGLVIYKFGETSAQFQDFFPLGLEEYHNAREGEVGALFERFQSKCVLHLTADYPADVTAFGTLLASFDTAFAARQAVVVQLDTIATGRHQDRKALTVQLTKNLQTIAINNIDNPDKFDDYFDTAYLPITNDTGATPMVKEGPVNAGMNQNIDLSDIPDADVNSNLKLFNPNSGSIVLRYYYADSTAGFPMPTVYVDVNPGETPDKVASQLGATSTNTYLMVQNLSGTNGDYKVEIVA